MDKKHSSAEAPPPRSLVRVLSPSLSGPLFGTIFFLVTAGMLVWLASYGMREIERTNAERLRSMAAAAAAMVDAGAHERLQHREDTGNADYLQASRELVQFHNSQPWIEWIYTLRVREGRLYYVIDTVYAPAFRLVRDLDFASRVMDPVREFYLEDEPGLLPAVLAGDTHVDQRDYGSQGRFFRSAQAPIRDQAGNVVAILGVDVDTTQLRAAQQGLWLRLLPGLLLCALLAAALGIGTARMHRALQASIERLEREGATDALTGLGNRNQFRRALDVAVAQARRRAQPLALLVFDIDHLRRINDSHGYAAGDELLRTIGARLRELARGADVCCRIDGGEFALLMPGLELRDAEGAFQRLSAAIRAPVVLDGEPRSVTISGGIALLGAAADDADADAVLRRAEQALADARNAGRDRVAVAT